MSADALLAQATAELLTGRLTDPFAFLGPHETPEGRVIRAFLPGALEVEALSRSTGVPLGRLSPMLPHGLFAGRVNSEEPYLLRITWPGALQETEDPYSFGPLLGELDLHLFNEGRHFELAAHLGANVTTVDGVTEDPSEMPSTTKMLWVRIGGTLKGRPAIAAMPTASMAPEISPPGKWATTNSRPPAVPMASVSSTDRVLARLGRSRGIAVEICFTRPYGKSAGTGQMH